MTIDLHLIGTVLGIILTFLGVVGMLGAWLNSLGLRPIKEVLYAIKEELSSLNKEIEQSKEDRRHIDVRLSKVEESARLAHKRIDDIGRE